MNNREIDDLELLKFSLGVALTGDVTDNMFAVTASIKDKSILIRFFYEGNVSEDDLEVMSVIETQIMAAFPQSYHDYTIDYIDNINKKEFNNSENMLDFWALMKSRNSSVLEVYNKKIKFTEENKILNINNSDFLEKVLKNTLLGEITNNMFAITGELKSKNIFIKFFYEGDISDDDIKRISIIEKKLIFQFPDDYKFTIDYISNVDKAKFNNSENMLHFWAFMKSRG